MMKSKQNENGNRDENLLCETFCKEGYWSHNLAKSSSGSQPFDVIAIKDDGDVWCVDSKNVEKKVSFTFDRIEENQISAMTYLRDDANWKQMDKVGFVIYFGKDMDNPRFLKFEKFEEDEINGKKSVNMNDLPLFINELHKGEKNK